MTQWSLVKIYNHFHISFFVFSATVIISGCISDNTDNLNMGLREDAIVPQYENTQVLCEDGLDNDRDSLVDCRDRECAEFCLPELFCVDGIDNDEDGAADCDDLDCMYVAPCLEPNCTDGIDNDFNGLIDCDDPSCDRLKKCLEEKILEQTPITCANKIDDDNDSFFDCDDMDCAVFTICMDTLIHEDTYYKCHDKLDNDKDGLFDCGDPDCAKTEVCLPEANCGDGEDNDSDTLIDCDDTDCNQTEACMPELNCFDGQDNDQDTLIDCEDPDCAEFSKCMGEFNCRDTVDNDNDGKTDCEDTDCKGVDVQCIVAEQNCSEDLGAGVDCVPHKGPILFPGGEDYSFGITIKNNCEFPLWIHMTGKNTLDTAMDINNGKALLLKRKSRMRIDSVPQIRGGRIYGIYKDPGDTADFERAISGYNSLVEMTLDTRLNFNISYVDNIALPVSVTGNNTDCQTTQCTLPNTPRFLNAVRDLCPTELEYEHQVGCYSIASCMSSYDFCLKDSNYVYSSYCTDMRDAYGDDPRLIFGMSYVEGDTEAQKKQAVAWNRGVAVGERRSWLYYPENHPTPINEYAAMIHKDMGCTAYAFALDDHSGDGAMSFCETSKELVVTWCPREELEDGEGIDAQGSAQCPVYEDNWIIP